MDSELQVADPLGGWDFRPYSPVLWRWLRATFQHTPFMLSSATLSTESLERIKVSLGIDREEVLVLSSSCDRPNVYQQTRRLRRRVDVWYAKYDFRKRDLDPKDASASKNKTSSNASTGFYSSQPVM